MNEEEIHKLKAEYYALQKEIEAIRKEWTRKMNKAKKRHSEIVNILTNEENGKLF